MYFSVLENKECFITKKYLQDFSIGQNQGPS